MSGRYWIVFGIVSLTAFNIGCSFSAKSAADGSYQPGLELPGDFTKTWSVGSGTSSDYTTSGADVIYTVSTAELRPLGTDASNDSSLGFGAGTATDIVWNGTNALQMDNLASATPWVPGDPDGAPATAPTAAISATAEFLSRIFTASSSLTWTKLSWTSDFPAGKPLPDLKAKETAYASNFNVDMKDNVLLFHLDDAFTGTAGDVKNATANLNHGRSFGTLTSIEGRFANAANFNSLGKYIKIDDDGTHFGIADQVTIEAWVYPEIDASNENRFMGLVVKRDSSSEHTTNFGLSYMKAGGSSRPVICFELLKSDNTWARYNTRHELSNNEWNHVVATFDNNGPGNEYMKIYVNGQLLSGGTGSGSGGFKIALDNSPLIIGALTDALAATNGFAGKIDEVAIYNTVLTDDEVTARFVRGASRLKVQVAGCPVMTPCDGNQTFVGPDGTSGTFFTEGSNGSISNTTEADLTTVPSGVSGGTFQYKVIMENDDGVQTPLLKSVSVTPTVYTLAKPDLAPQTGTAYKNLKSFAATTGGAGTVKFQLIKDASSAYYWDGSQWTAATLSSHTNTAAEINTNIATFPTEIGTGTLRFKAFFDSGDGSEKPTLTSVTIEGDR